MCGLCVIRAVRQKRGDDELKRSYNHTNTQIRQSVLSSTNISFKPSSKQKINKYINTSLVTMPFRNNNTENWEKLIYQCKYTWLCIFWEMKREGEKKNIEQNKLISKMWLRPIPPFPDTSTRATILCRCCCSCWFTYFLACRFLLLFVIQTTDSSTV